MFGGQFERLIRKGQILPLEPDLFVRAELIFWNLSGYPVERCFGLFSSLSGYFHLLFHSGNRRFSPPSVVQVWEIPQ